MIVVICLLFTSAFKSMFMEVIVRVWRDPNGSCTVSVKNCCLRHLIGEEVDKRSLAILPLCVLLPILWFVFRKT